MGLFDKLFGSYTDRELKRITPIVDKIEALADTYAYKVQYLQSSGVQHIDTGVVPDRNTMYRGSYEYLGTAGAKANYDMIAACTSPRYSRGTRGL